MILYPPFRTYVDDQLGVTPPPVPTLRAIEVVNGCQPIYLTLVRCLRSSLLGRERAKISCRDDMADYARSQEDGAIERADRGAPFASKPLCVYRAKSQKRKQGPMSMLRTSEYGLEGGNLVLCPSGAIIASRLCQHHVPPAKENPEFKINGYS